MNVRETLKLSKTLKSSRDDFNVWDNFNVPSIKTANVTAPLGEIPTKPFKVVWFLWALKSSQFNCKLLGIWHITSVQSIMTLVDLYLPLKDLGIVSITFLLGQMFICPNLKNIKLTHVINILLIADADTLNNWARWSSGNPCLSLHMTIKNSSRGLKDHDLRSIECRTFVVWMVSKRKKSERYSPIDCRTAGGPSFSSVQVIWSMITVNNT